MDSTAILGGVLKEMAADLRTLFYDGIEVGPSRYYFALVGVKGDAEFHVEAGEFLRSYMTVGTANNLKMCPECEADDNFGDCSDNPVWLSTVPYMCTLEAFLFGLCQSSGMTIGFLIDKSLTHDCSNGSDATKVGNSVPWDDGAPPPLSSVPFSGDHYPAFLYKRDMFHIIKHGVGRESCASILLMLAYLGYFDSENDSKNLPDRLSRGFQWYKLWCQAEQKTSTLKNFTRANLHFAKASSFPYLGGKGADVTLVLMFLEFFLQLCRREPKDGDRVVLSAMLQLVQGTLNFIGIMHSHDLWLPKACTGFMMKQGLQALRAYSFCAKMAMQSHRRLFCMRPKFHSWAHTVFELKKSYDMSISETLSPAVFNCEANEDFIGRISRISRHVSPRLVIFRSLQRYGVGFQSRLRKMRRHIRRG